MTQKELDRDFLNRQARDAAYFLDSIVESSQDSIVAVDFDGIVTNWNQSAERVYGYPASEAVGKALTTLDLSEDFAKVFGKIDDVKHNRRTEIHDTVRVRRSGRQMDLEIFLSPVKDRAGRIIGVSTIARDVTGSRRAEEALRESEERYRTLFDSIDEGYFLGEVIFDDHDQPVDILYLDANPAATRLIGQNYVGRRLTEIDPNFEPYWFEVFGRVARSGTGERLVNYARPLDAWYDFYVLKIGDADSRRIGIVFRDITGSKRREANRKFLDGLAEDFSRHSAADEIMRAVGARIGGFLKIRSCHIVAIDEARDEVRYLDRWDAPGVEPPPDPRSLSARVTDEFLKPVRARQTIVSNDAANDPRIRSAGLAGIGTGAFITVPFHQSGEWKYLFAVHDAAPRQWREDEIELVQELANRIFPRLERARAEQRLRESEARLSAIFSEAEVGLSEISIGGRFLRVNETCCRILGRSREEILTLTMTEVTHAEDVPASLASLKRLVETGEPVSIDKRYIRPDGKIVWAVNTLSLLPANGNQPPRILAVISDITERQTAQSALRESEERLRLILESINAAFYAVDKDFNFTYVNQKAEELWGRKRETLNGRHYWTEFPQAVGTVSYEMHFEAMKQRRAVHFETISPLVGIWISVSIYPDKQGGLSVYFRDITDQKRAEEALRRSEEKYRTLVENVSDYATYMLDANGFITEWTESARRVKGFTDEEAVGKHISMFFTAEAVAAGEPENELSEAADRGRAEREGWRVRKGGELFMVNEIATAIRDAAGNLIGFTKICRDITERRLAEERLRASEARLQLIIESVTDHAILTQDAEGIIRSWNSGAEKIFGYAREEAVGRHADITFTPEDREKRISIREMKTALAKGRAEDERWHIRRDGTRFFASGVLTPLADGGAQGFVKIARDLTERQAAEKARRDKEMLRKLVQAQEEERKRIARDLHDELGQQLTALRLMLDAVGRPARADDPLVSRIEEIQNLARRIDEGIDYLAWDLRPAALDDLGLTAALDKFAAEWSAHTGIEAEMIYSNLKKMRFAPEVEINLYRIVQEALNNVYKHSAATAVEIVFNKRNDSLALIVEDNGHGFDPADKGNRSRGLGLNGIQERVALIGGDFEIESSAGDGTTIYVRVPLAVIEEERNGK